MNYKKVDKKQFLKWVSLNSLNMSIVIRKITYFV